MVGKAKIKRKTSDFFLLFSPRISMYRLIKLFRQILSIHKACIHKSEKFFPSYYEKRNFRLPDWQLSSFNRFRHAKLIVHFIQAILNRIEKTLKKYNNDLTKCLLCCCKCCLWCLEKFMRFINRNAYIMCATKGTNFCVSAKDAFSLLMRNVVRTY